MDRKYHVVLNPKAGGALALGLTGDILRAHFERAGYQATVDDDAEVPLHKRIELAVQSEADTVVAAGGDGTVTAIAHALLSSQKTLGILPTGTANLLARDLKIPLDLEKAVAALGNMQPRRIDVGEVNGRTFLHNVTVGLIPKIAEAREQIRGETDLGTKIGFVRYFLDRLATARRLAVELVLDGGEPRIQRVQAISVANNAYDEGFGHVFSRPRLDAGCLTIYTLKRLKLKDLARLTLGMAIGRWQAYEVLTIDSACQVTLRLKRSSIMTMLDGEVEEMTLPLNMRTRPGALWVLAPGGGGPAEEGDQPEFVVGI